MKDRSHLSIGEVLSLLQDEFPDMTISKIRFLESQGLLDPERTPSGYRKFYDTDLRTLRYILVEQRDNFLPLKVIKERLAAGRHLISPAAEGVGADLLDAEPGRIGSDEPHANGSDPLAVAGAEAALPGPTDSPAPEPPATGTGSPPTSGASDRGPADRPPVGSTAAEGGGVAPGDEIAGIGAAVPGGSTIADGAPGGIAAGSVGPSASGRPGDQSGVAGSGGPGGATRFGSSPGGDVGRGRPAAEKPLGRRPDRADEAAASAANGPVTALAPGGAPDRSGRSAAGDAGAHDRGGEAAPFGFGGGPSTELPEAGDPGPGGRPGRTDAGASGHRVGAPAEGGESPSAGAGEGRRVGGARPRLDDLTSVSMSLGELARACGLEAAELRELERYGLISGRQVGADVVYGGEDLLAAQVAATFARHGIEARHLRPFRMAADREVGLYEQVVAPRLRARGQLPGAGPAELLAELTELGESLHRVLVQRSLGAILGGD